MERETTAQLYALKEDEEGLPNYFYEDLTVARSIDEEDPIEYCINILSKIHDMDLIPTMTRIFDGSKILARPKDNDIISDVTLYFLLPNNVDFKYIKQYIEFIEYHNDALPGDFMFCGRCIQKYKATGPLGCPCLLDESSGDEGCITD